MKASIARVTRRRQVIETCDVDRNVRPHPLRDVATPERAHAAVLAEQMMGLRAPRVIAEVRFAGEQVQVGSWVLSRNPYRGLAVATMKSHHVMADFHGRIQACWSAPSCWIAYGALSSAAGSSR